ncbi:hypothetical protein [Sorangium sp. So ce693]|uniref:hypothetical protein n=1 Tax=Sorangium sp. So ce693 TaxID=3133318 RepID=UPI003F63F9B4
MGARSSYPEGKLVLGAAFSCAGRGRLVVVQPIPDVNGASDRPSASDDAPGPPASALDRGRLGSKE